MRIKISAKAFLQPMACHLRLHPSDFCQTAPSHRRAPLQFSECSQILRRIVQNIQRMHYRKRNCLRETALELGAFKTIEIIFKCMAENIHCSPYDQTVRSAFRHGRIKYYEPCMFAVTIVLLFGLIIDNDRRFIRFRTGCGNRRDQDRPERFGDLWSRPPHKLIRIAVIQRSCRNQFCAVHC